MFDIRSLLTTVWHTPHIQNGHVACAPNSSHGKLLDADPIKCAPRVWQNCPTRPYSFGKRALATDGSPWIVDLWMELRQAKCDSDGHSLIFKEHGLILESRRAQSVIIRKSIAEYEELLSGSMCLFSIIMSEEYASCPS